MGNLLGVRSAQCALLQSKATHKISIKLKKAENKWNQPPRMCDSRLNTYVLCSGKPFEGENYPSFIHKILGVPQALIIEGKKFVKAYTHETLFPIDSRNFSPSNVYCCPVQCIVLITITSTAKLQFLLTTFPSAFISPRLKIACKCPPWAASWKYDNALVLSLFVPYPSRKMKKKKRWNWKKTTNLIDDILKNM